jgi:AraC-like DNA-binding protein
MQSNPSKIHPASPLIHALEDCILPALEWDADSRVVIAREKRELLKLPTAVQALPLRRHGQRVAVRHSKAFQRAVHLTAKWPKDGLQELRIPKLLAVVEGQTGFRAGDYILQCPAGTIIFLPPGVPYTDGTVSHLETLYPDVQYCSLFWITPMISGLACRLCHTTGEKHWSNAQGEKVFLHTPQTLQLFNMLADEGSCNPHESVNTPVFASLLLALLRTVFRDIQERRFLLQDVAPHEAEHQPSEENPMEQAVQYINGHYASSLNLDEIARRFLMSRALFTRKFREHTGQSFLGFLNARRLEQACQLLTETDWTAVMIARYVGLGSAAYFHRLFMREMQVSPMQYRKLHKTQVNKKYPNG